MRLRALRIERLPGISPPGFSLEELQPGINLVVGPNASGKTSLTRALQAVLYRETARDVPVQVEAEFEHENEVFRAVRIGRDIHWTREGQPAEAPVLPDYHLRRCYVMGVEDLFSEGETDQRIAEHLERELAGGYDLSKAVERSRLGARQVRPRRGSSRKRRDGWREPVGSMRSSGAKNCAWIRFVGRRPKRLPHVVTQSAAARLWRSSKPDEGARRMRRDLTPSRVEWSPFRATSWSACGS